MSSRDAPHLLEQMLMRDHAPLMLGKHLKQAVFLRRQLYPGAIDRYRASREVYGQRSGPDDGIGLGASTLSPNGCSGARQELRHGERLDDVVVDAEIEQSHFLLFVFPHRQHDDGNGRPGS